jgi:hypothetical protein
MTEKPTSFQDWLGGIDDADLHHIGQYFEARYGKPFQKKNSHATAAFKRWWLQQNTDAIAETVARFGFEITRDWDPYGFFIQKKGRS